MAPNSNPACMSHAAGQTDDAHPLPASSVTNSRASRLVQFSGDDQRPRPRRIERKTERTKKPSAYDLFRLGKDTAEIAELLGVEEHVALRRINVERSKRLDLPSPYEVTA